jgi:hypothetical protein
MLRACVFLPLVVLFGCSSEPEGGAADEPAPSVDVGIPAGDGLDFAHLEEGGELRIQTFGQGGTHVLFAVQTVGLGNRAFVTMTVRNLTTGAEVMAPAPARPQLFICNDDGVCDLVPLLVMMAGISAPDEERHGLRVEVRVDVENEAGLSAHTTREGVLSTEDL